VIVCFGSVNLDLIFAVPSLPGPGETVLGPTVRLEPGGKGANQALAAARDGARVVLAGAVGGDALAADALALLRDSGVDLGRIAIAAASTGCAAICVDAAGRNLIAVGSGANLAARQAQIEDALLGPDTVLLLQRETAPDEIAALIRRAHAAGARIVLNLAPAGPIAPDALSLVDVLVVNETEAAWLAGTLGCAPDAAAIRAALGGDVVMTLGGAGVAAATAAGAFRLAAHQVAVVDTTAAGDCFTGVLAAALDRGLGMAPALARANAAAALCCTRPGSQSTLPLASEIDTLVG
jgi:ribokinase